MNAKELMIFMKEHQPIGASGIAELMNVKRTAASSMLRDLKEKGYLLPYEYHEGAYRRVTYTVTDDGIDFIDGKVKPKQETYFTPCEIDIQGLYRFAGLI